MTNIEKVISERSIPSLMQTCRGKKIKTKSDFMLRREEIKKILQEEEYGYIPEKPEHLTVDVINEMPTFAAGKANKKELKFTVTIGGADFSFPVVSVIPKKEGRYPAFVHINFRPEVPDRYMPTEEIIDNGFAIFSFCYKDVTSDDGNFKNGIAPYFRKGKRRSSDPGKIAMWAFAAMRVMDYIETLDSIDTDNVAVIGHSRLGKTALVTGGFDERFKYVISNDSGCSGAAITRGKQGETPMVITNVFPFWFCPKYVKSAAEFENVKYDQHFLLALTAPRYLMIGSAEEDIWADPESEFLSAVMASEVYPLFGKTGLVYKDEIPKAKTVLGEGEVLYQLRSGCHYLGREDWLEYMKFIKAKMAEEK